ncbi:MAG: hypothetical protein ACJASR_002264 [Psychroserpens sp.]|jgi:hypothetical protein
MKVLNFIKSDGVISSLILAGLILAITAITTFLWNENSISLSTQINSEKMGHFGDIFGGLIGSIWALAGIFLFYKALVEQRVDFAQNREAFTLQIKALNEQRKEFELTREEMVSSRKIYEEQSNTLKLQQFESNFYSLLHLYRNIKNEVDSDEGMLFEKLLEEILSKEPCSSALYFEEQILSYEKVYAKYRDKLSPLFKSFYRIISNIDSCETLTDREKHKYAKIFRSQLSDFEIVLIYFNAFTKRAEKIKKYILKYNLLKHKPAISTPEYKKYLNKNSPKTLINFHDELSDFMSKHVDMFYDLNSEKDKVEEHFVSISAIVGIYFNDSIEIRIFLKNELSTHDLNFNDNEFISFLKLIIIEISSLNSLVEKEKIKLESYKKESDDEKEFCIRLITDEKININKDKY